MDKRRTGKGRDKRSPGEREVNVREYEKKDGTLVSAHTRTVSGNKKDIIRDERELNRTSKNLLKDTREEDYRRSEYDVYEIDSEARNLQPMIKEAQASQAQRKEAENAKGQLKVQKQNTRTAKEQQKSKRNEYRRYKKEKKASAKAEKYGKKLEKEKGT